MIETIFYLILSSKASIRIMPFGSNRWRLQKSTVMHLKHYIVQKFQDFSKKEINTNEELCALLSRFPWSVLKILSKFVFSKFLTHTNLFLSQVFYLKFLHLYVICYYLWRYCHHEYCKNGGTRNVIVL